MPSKFKSFFSHHCSWDPYHLSPKPVMTTFSLVTWPVSFPPSHPSIPARILSSRKSNLMCHSPIEFSVPESQIWCVIHLTCRHLDQVQTLFLPYKVWVHVAAYTNLYLHSQIPLPQHKPCSIETEVLTLLSICYGFHSFLPFADNVPFAYHLHHPCLPAIICTHFSKI